MTKQPVSTKTRQITFELYDEHPLAGDYCVFANEIVEKTNLETLDFAFVDKIIEINNEQFVSSPDLYCPVKLIYCWKLKMSVHD